MFLDKLGRQTQDRVTSLGTGVDGAVRRIASTYEVRGMREKITSYDNPNAGSGTIDNEAKFNYNSFVQLTTEYQEHGGSVNTSTSLKAQYGYANGGESTIRPTQLTYPNGRALNFNYGSSGGTGDAMNRVAALLDNDGSSHLVDYSYLGLGLPSPFGRGAGGEGGFVKADYAEPDVRWDLAFGTGNDPHDGLDRFDRVVDNRWLNYATSTDVDRVQYGYDRSGNRTYREQTCDSNSNVDEVYGYDVIDRLKSMDRGPLNAQKTGVTTLKFAQCWGLDSTGNSRDFREDADGAGGWDLIQSRSHNGVNEISDITETQGPAWITPQYDRAGNMTRVPKPSDPTQYYTCTYDAWNRLVKVMDGQSTVAEYRYDGAKRRIVKKTYTGGQLSETRHFYYTEPSKWQVIEERLAPQGQLSSYADRQFIWGLRYIDDLVLRDRDADGNANTGNLGKTGSGLEERVYAIQDANWNVTALSNTTGSIQERYAYSAYGTALVLTAAFGSRASSSYAWETLFAGYRWDSEIRFYCVRNRVLVPNVNWLGRDPIRYSAGSNLYEYVGQSPTDRADPTGLYEIYGPAPEAKVTALSKADASAKPKIALWARFLKEIPDNVMIYDGLEKLGLKPGEIEPRIPLVRQFAARLRTNIMAINDGLTASSHQVRFEDKDKGNWFAQTVKYLALRNALFGTKDYICFFPKFFKKDPSTQTGLYVHEMSHYYADIKLDEYDWTGPEEGTLLHNADVAQLYEQLGKSTTDRNSVKLIFWGWVRDWLRESRKKN